MSVEYESPYVWNMCTALYLLHALMSAERPVVSASGVDIQADMGLLLVGRHCKVASVERFHRAKLLTGVSGVFSVECRVLWNMCTVL